MKYSNVIILPIFVFALLITIAEIPNIFENVLAQQQPGGSQQKEDSSNRDRIPPGTEDPTTRGDRIHDDQRRSSSEGDNQNSDEDSTRHLDRIFRDIDRTSEDTIPPGKEDPTTSGDRIHDDQRRSSSEGDNPNSDEDSIRDLDKTSSDIDGTSEEVE